MTRPKEPANTRFSIIGRREFLELGAFAAAGACVTTALPSIAGAANTRGKFEWKLCPPVKVGMSRSGLEQVRAAIQKNIDNNVIPGAVTAIARHNKLVWFEAQGVRKTDPATPMRNDDIFRMMSGTKPVTAVAVLMMMDAGKLSLDDKVNRYLPTFKNMKVAVAPPGTKDPAQVKLVPAERDITIKDLLTHTSGLSSAGLSGPGPSSLVNKIERKPDDTLADYIPRLGSAALDFQPGSRWSYSPLDGFDTLLRIVEIVSEQPADVFCRERIFKPLNMNNTFFHGQGEKQDRIVTIYDRKNGTWEVQQQSSLFENVKYFCGAGGLFSTAHDYMQFEEMLLNHGELNGQRIVKPETVALMARNQVGTLFAEWIPIVTAGHGFGLGVRVVEDASKGGGRSVGAFGWGGAYGTESWADPELDLAAVMFIQLSSPPRNVMNDFQQAIRKAIVG